MYKSSGLQAKLRYFAIDYGSITVLEKKRPLNPGDVALMELLADKCSLYFAVTEKRDDPAVNMRVLNELLEYKIPPKEMLEHHYSMITGRSRDKSCSMSLMVLRLKLQGQRHVGIGLARSIFMKQYPALYNWVYRDDLLVISYVPEPETLARQIFGYMESQGYANNLQLSMSLPFNELVDLPYYYEQTIYAMDSMSEKFCLFYDCGYKYLLENTDLQHKVLACEPLCRQIWMEEPEKREFLRTLSAYLALERSTTLTAEALSIHRNTIYYRVKDIREYSDWDYENVNLRNYLRLSIHYLTEWEITQKSKE